MSPELEIASVILRTIGAIAGSFLSLVFFLPKSWREAGARGSGSLVSGFVFGPQVQDYLSWPATADNVMAASALAGFAAWQALGVVVRIVSMFRLQAPPGDAPAKE